MALEVIQAQRASRERPLEALEQVVVLRAFCDEVEAELVDIARAPKGEGWWNRDPRFTLRQIAVALGRSKSSVHRQYGDSWVDAHASIRARQAADRYGL